jgi:hypothetical protein
VKRAIILVILVAAGFAGGVFWMKHHAGGPPPEAKAPAEKEPAAGAVSRDTNGNAVVTLNGKTGKDLGIIVTNPAPFQMSPEIKGYGKVLDPAPLAALAIELTAAQATYAASSNELARVKGLQGQGNASVRSLEAADAAALRDYLAVRSVKERVALAWGKAVAEQKDPAAFVRSLTSLEAALIRVDLLPGEAIDAQPSGARIVTLSDRRCEAELLGPAPNVDPQLQGRGFLLLVMTNSLHLAAGESVVGYIKVPGAPLTGVVIPSDAVLRTEGAGWVYVQKPTGNAFTRVEIGLDHATEAGWFITNGVSASDHVIVSGAQQLLSLELKGAGAAE